MKTIILAGGFGSRISISDNDRPKPLVRIGNKPIIWHIMKSYMSYGFNDFLIAGGYKVIDIKKYFWNLELENSDIDINFISKKKKFILSDKFNCKMKVIDTGVKSQTGYRLKSLQNFLKNDEDFMLTYGDGLSNVNIKKLIEYHKSHKKIATMTVVNPPARFGYLKIDKKNSSINEFQEKKSIDESWINGGFFVFNKRIFNYLKNDFNCVLEKEPLENLAKDNQIMAFKHKGFWQCMDTKRDYDYLNEIYKKDKKEPWLND